MVFWDTSGWGLCFSWHGYIILQRFSSKHLPFWFMVVIRVVPVLSGPVFGSSESLCRVQFGSESLFVVHVESLVFCSPLSLHTWCTHLVHLVIWSFILSMCYSLFSWVRFTYFVLMCAMLLIWDIFSLWHHWSLRPDLSWRILSLLTWDHEIDLESLRLWLVSSSD